MKTIDEINEKIAREEAIILTAAELKSIVRDGQMITARDVDVVTTGTIGVMSGTMAVMMVPVAEKCSFEKADSIWLNGAPAQPGPCPNERLGVVDLVIHGTSHADDRYGGGHLFLLENFLFRFLTISFSASIINFLEPDLFTFFIILKC